MQQPPSASSRLFSSAMPFETPKVCVELSVSAVNLRDKDGIGVSDPVCILFLKEKGSDSFIEIDRTEMIKNSLNPQWLKKFNIDYRFEERQMLKFAVYDWDTKSNKAREQDFLGDCECSLGEIMSSEGTQLKKQLAKNGGTLNISGEEVSTSNEVAHLSFSARNLDKKDFMGKSDPFLVFSRALQDGSFIAVHKTEVISNNINPVWKSFRLPVRVLCGGDDDKPIKITCYDWDSDGTHDLIGECTTKLRNVRKGIGSTNTYTLINPKKQKKSSYKGSGELILNAVSLMVEPSFLDYIRQGLQIHFTVAIDFTASNGNPSKPNSLHFRQPGVDNQYTLAIKAVGEIIQDYDSDKMFPALGFGAKLPQGDVSHEFFLNGRVDNPYCQGIDGILEAYQYSLQTVTLYGPTNFSPVICHVRNFAESHQDGRHYFILLIITDGIISDLNETRRALVESCRFPLSVVIVGVGDEDFSAMEHLDGDENRLSFSGRFAERDIVQFVELRKFLSSNTLTSREALAAAVLKEIPSQVTVFMGSKTH